MSIFKTTLNVESANIADLPIKFTTSVNNDLVDDIVFSKISVNSNTSIEINPESNGAKGSYLYIKSTATNPKHTAINIFFGMGEEISTLYAGEFAIIPLSKDLSTLSAITTHGTAELEYFFGTRGEEIGENALIKWKNVDTNTWWFQTLDVATGTPGPQVNTGFNYTTYPSVNDAAIVNRKGYILDFYDNNNQENDRKVIFINSRGSIEDTETLAPGFSTNVGDGRANLITYTDGTDGTAIHFDGDTVSTHTFLDISDIYIDSNWDDCTADGTFPLVVEGYDGGSDEALFLIKGGDKTLIKTTDAGNNYYSNAYVYSHGNFVAVETINEGGSPQQIETLEIFSTDGTLLKTVDFDGMPLNNLDHYFYGSGKLQVVYQDDDTSDYIFLNYNQLTGKLIGEDLQWTSTLTDYEVVSGNYQTGYGRNYKPESVAILLYTADSIDSSYLLNQDSDGDLEVTYIINNDLEQRNYIVPSTEDRYFQVYNNVSSINDFVLLSGDNRTTGALVATRFSSGAEPTRYNLISNYSIYDADGGHSIETFGDYRFLILPRIAGNISDVIVYDGLKVLDTLPVNTSGWDNYYEYNSLLIEEYSTDKQWYFNTSTKKFVLLPTYAENTESSNDEGDQYPINQGKIVLRRFKDNADSTSIYGRVITKGIASAEKELIRFGNAPNFSAYGMGARVSTETIMVWLQEYSNTTIKVRVFDLNLNFLYEIDTQKNNYDDYDNIGKINSMILYNNDNLYKFYNFNKLLNSTEIEATLGYNEDYNNYGWW